MKTAGFLALCLCAAPRLATAQTMQWTDKGYVTVNGGAQVGSDNLDSTSTFTLYDETASVTTAQKVKGGGFFDLGGAYRVWGRNVLAGLSYSHTSSDSNATVNASIPDPLVTDRPRNVTTSLSGAKHSENALHLDAIYMIPVAAKTDVGVFGGPTIFFVKQQTVSTLTATEPGPTVSAPLTDSDKTTVGINFGVDVQYMIAKKWGVGGLARYSWGSADLGGSAGKLKVGGFQIGGGFRWRLQ
jgi:hypothetical protein